MKGLKGKTVVVTGASSGIGEALARECAVQGANVVLGARSLQKLQLIVGDIRSKGGEAIYCAVDVTKPEECRNLIDTAVGSTAGWMCSSAMRAFRCGRCSMTWIWRCCTV